LSKQKHKSTRGGRFRAFAYFKRADGTWRGISSPWFVGSAEPILLARGVLERHHITRQSAAAAVVDAAGEIIWQGNTAPDSDIRIQTSARSAENVARDLERKKRAHLRTSKASGSGGGV
jgi:hypothetical protein